MRTTIAVLAVLLATSCSLGPNNAAKVKMTVVSWTPEDAHHVAAVLRYTNPTASATKAICTVAAYDDGNSQVGQDTDGPADDIPAGKSLTIRVLVKTDVDSALVAKVDQMSGVPCG